MACNLSDLIEIQESRPTRQAGSATLQETAGF
jgi:hypothetical protein